MSEAQPHETLCWYQWGPYQWHNCRLPKDHSGEHSCCAEGDAALRAVAAGAGDRRALSSELRTDLERHAAWLDGLHLGIGKELATWLVECPHYAALWKEQVDENARLRAALGDRPPAPSDAMTRSRIDHWLRNRRLMLCTPDHHAGFGSSVDTLMALLEDLGESGAVRPPPCAAVERLERIIGFAQEIQRATLPGDAHQCARHVEYEAKAALREGAASPAAALPQGRT